ncbi:unnamed protein product, partial [Prorocentrum cordatum]
ARRRGRGLPAGPRVLQAGGGARGRGPAGRGGGGGPRPRSGAAGVQAGGRAQGRGGEARLLGRGEVREPRLDAEFAGEEPGLPQRQDRWPLVCAASLCSRWQHG